MLAEEVIFKPRWDLVGTLGPLEPQISVQIRYQDNSNGGFHKWGVPLNHPFIDGISHYRNHPAIPFMEPKWRQFWCRICSMTRGTAPLWLSSFDRAEGRRWELKDTGMIRTEHFYLRCSKNPNSTHSTPG